MQQQAKKREDYLGAVKTARDYYNSEDADNFYTIVWGGEDIHVGLYEYPGEKVFDASRRTVAEIASRVPGFNENTRVIDIGSGYGGAARYLAREYGCRVVALNLSERENERGRRLTAEQGLDDRVDIVDGSFEDIPYKDGSFDVVWSQDAFLHSGDRRRVLEEAVRVLAPGGYLVFTDPMQTDDCPPDVLQPIYDRLLLETLGSPSFYRETLTGLGLEEIDFDERAGMIANHYGRVREVLVAEEEEVAKNVSHDYIERMKRGLQHWVDGGNNGYLTWGIFVYRKPEKAGPRRQ